MGQMVPFRFFSSDTQDVRMVLICSAQGIGLYSVQFYVFAEKYREIKAPSRPTVTHCILHWMPNSTLQHRLQLNNSLMHRQSTVNALCDSHRNSLLAGKGNCLRSTKIMTIPQRGIFVACVLHNKRQYRSFSC